MVHGAVSEEVAEEMVKGVKMKFDSDCGISTTGIAGPTGGTPTKPVGLVFIGIGLGEKVRVFKKNFKGTREEVKLKTAYTAIDLLRREIIGEYGV